MKNHRRERDVTEEGEGRKITRISKMSQQEPNSFLFDTNFFIR